MPIPTASAEAASLRRIALFVVAAYAVAFLYGFSAGRWLIDEAGRPIANDFVNVWAAGRMALEGMAAGAYDWTAHKAYETLAVGYDFDVYFGWHYPPMFFLLAAPLALLPYTAGHLAWMAATAPLYAGAIAMIMRARGAALAALAFPAAAWNFGYGQNGFLTAALLGAGLVMVRSRPVLAGVMFGLLTYKPQFGILIPLALVAGGHWRTIAAACVTALAVAGLATLCFGPDVWPAFLASTKLTNHAVLVKGWAGFGELLSVFGATRWAGGPLTLAWALQGGIAALLGIAVWRAWRGPAPADLAAALLAAASLMASPYVYIYDLTALAVAVAFLARAGVTVAERQILGVVCVLILGGPLTETPVTALAAPIVLAIVLRKIVLANAALRAPCTPAMA